MKSPKKILLFISLTVMGIILTGIGLSIYYWQQLTQLPDWYSGNGKPTSSSANLNLDPAALHQNQRTLQQKLQTQIHQQWPNAQFSTDSPASSPSSLILGLPVTLPQTSNAIALQLDNGDLQQVLIDGIARNPKTKPLLKATKGFKTTITDQSIAIGTVINSQSLLQSVAHSPEQQKVTQFFQQFPQFKDRDLAIQLEGTPRLEQGKLILDNNSTLTIGTVRFSLAELAQRLGISTDQIRQYLTIQAKADGLKAIQLQENQLTLKIAPIPSTRNNEP